MNTQPKHLTPFIPSALDDYGLSPAQFRVLCAIARRGECFETVAALARRCQLHRHTVWRALRVLVQKRAIAKQIRSGQTNVFRIRPLADWEAPSSKECPSALETYPHHKIRPATYHKRIPTEVTPPKVLPLSYSPAQVDDPLFISTWEKWMEYRRGLRNKPRNIEGMFAEQLTWLAGYPNAVAIEIIQQSLRNGWQGLFPPKGGVTARATAPQASVWELKQRLAALDAQIEEVRARGYEDAFGLQLEAEDRRELKRLKALRRELNALLADPGAPKEEGF